MLGNIISLAFISLLVVSSSMGKPNGAPPQACATMEPQHYSLPSNEPCPFETVLDQIEIYSNESLTLTLRVSDPPVSADWDSFQGFLVMGFNQETNQVLGTFDKPLPGDNFQTLECLDEIDIAATHINIDSKTSIDLIWNPPIDFDGTVVFYTTFAASQDPYWVKEEAIQRVRVIRSSDEVTTESTLIPDQSTITPNFPDIYEGCQSSADNGVITKGCFGNPANCIETRDCTLMTSYRVIDDQTFEFEIYGKTTSSNSYVAVGFSEDRSMGKDSVIQCVNYQSNMAAYNSYNQPSQTNNRITNNDELNNSFQLLEATSYDGNLYCKVSQPADYSISDGPEFHLSKQPYYIFLAFGPTGSDEIQYHTSRFPSSNSFDLTVYNNAPTDSTTLSQSSSTFSPNFPDVYDGCSTSDSIMITKGCFGTPINCITSRSCTLMTTYRVIDDQTFEFEIYGETKSTDSYVALGFSDDDGMGGDSVIQCVNYQSTLAAYNSLNRKDYDDNNRLNNNNELDGNFELLEAAYNGNYIYCRVKQPSVYTIPEIGSEFRLGNQSYYILLAAGPTGSAEIQKHDSKFVSDDAIDLTNYNKNPESTTLSPNSSTILPNLPNIYDGCPTNASSASDDVSAIKKGCFGSPNNCIESRDCTLMTTYRVVDNKTFEFEIYGKETSRNSYVAVGFSEDSGMGEDSVIQCVNYQSVMAAYNSFNTRDESNKRLTGNNELNSNLLMEAVTFNGYLYCRVRQPADYKIAEINREFHLNNQSYYILMASGPTGSGEIQKHNPDSKFSSSEPIDLTKYDILNQLPVKITRKLHGSFMIIAWLVAASIGILMPRYMKKSFNGRKMMGKDLWFIIHQSCMIVAWLLTMAGFVIIFIEADGWAGNRAHPIIGCITTSLAFIQPFMAALRPDPNARNRYIFNWSHLLVGYLAHTLAVVCIFLAVDEAGLPEDTYWFLTTHVVCYVAAQIALTVLAMKKGDDQKKDESSPSSSMNRAVVSTFGLVALGLGITIIIVIAQL